MFLLASILMLTAGIRVPCAAEAKDYAYLFLQGTLSDRAGNRPLPGATVRLASSRGNFETLTNERGVFVFDKLPVAEYELGITTAGGEVIRSIQEVDLDVPELQRFRIRFGRGEEEGTARIEPGAEVVGIRVDAPPVRWRRFWTQFAIFAGGVLLVTL